MCVRNYITIGSVSLAALLCTGLWLTDVRPVRGNTEPYSRVDHSGLIVEFTLRCSDGAIQLHSSITNTTAAPITIQSGSLPWQYDVLGSDFSVQTEGGTLTRNWATPIMGRTGPILLKSHEKRVGTVPVSLLFPSLGTAVKKEAVVVHWKYWTDVKSVRSGRTVFDGSLLIRQNACSDTK
jgi:hypothetical protein